MKYLIILAGTVLLFATHAQSATLYFLTEAGYLKAVEVVNIDDPATLVAALATPPQSTSGEPLSSALPEGTRVLGLWSENETTIIEFSGEVLGAGLDDERLENLFAQVRATLHGRDVTGPIRLQTGGRLLSDYVPRTPVIEPRSRPKVLAFDGPGALAGKSISLSPGHGKVWTGSSYAFERPVYCSPLNREDDHNLEIMQLLQQYLTQDGAVTKVYRCLDKNFGVHTPSGEPWWRISAGYWLQSLGYPCSVFASSTGDCNLGTGATESADSLRSRPLASDYDATDIYVSLHSNGLNGDCAGTTCPNGTCTYYDTSSEHATWGAVSQTLATHVNSSIISAIRTRYTDSTWRDRGALDANGAYAETRIPNRAAILIELAFHDSCDRDAVALRDNFFRSTTMWATYKGICDYFSVTPTWDYYSYEVVSDTIPSVIKPGASVSVQITLRNRGVLWNDAKLFRLGAVNDSDPFTTTTRHNVGSEIFPGATRTFAFTLTAPSTEGIYTSDWRMLREGVTWFGPIISRQILVSTNGDQQPPSTPAGLVGTAPAFNQVDLRWNAATDNLFVSSYRIYRNAVLLDSAAATNYSDTTVSSLTSYSYQVSALDSSGNESPRSAPVSITTPPQLDFIIDNPQGIATGSWTLGTSSTDKYQADYHWTSTATTANGTFRWTPRIERAGFYNLQTWYPQGGNRCTNSPFLLRYSGGSTTVRIDQTINGGQWVSLGAARPFITGTNGYIELSNQTQQPAKVVMADAVRFTYASPLPALPALQASLQGSVLTLSWSNPYCVLQQSSVGNGTWTDIPGAISPHQVPTAGSSQKFYRLRY